MAEPAWPSVSYLARLLFIYGAVALMAGALFMIVAVSVVRPEIAVGVAAGVVIGFFLHSGVSRHRNAWIAELRRSLRL